MKILPKEFTEFHKKHMPELSDDVNALHNGEVQK